MWVSEIDCIYHGVCTTLAGDSSLTSHNRTCFWAGDIFAPKLRLKNKHGAEVGIQEYLQGAFLDMFAELARATGDLEGVIGFEVCLDHFLKLSLTTCR